MCSRHLVGNCTAGTLKASSASCFKVSLRRSLNHSLFFPPPRISILIHRLIPRQKRRRENEIRTEAERSGAETEREEGGFPWALPQPLSHVSRGIEWLTAAYQASFWVSVRSCPCFCPAVAKYISPLCKCSTSPATRPPASSGSLPLHRVHVPLGCGGFLGGGGGCVCRCVCVVEGVGG